MGLSSTFLLPLVLAIGPIAPAPETMRLIEFEKESDVGAWRPVHDGVMGGLSSGRATLVDGVAHFEGRVSHDNNGGFASFRLTKRFPDLSRFDGLRLRVRGDGQVYKISLRTDDGWKGVGWQTPFATRKAEWTTIDLAFEDLVPTWRGRLVRDAGAFDAATIQELGLVIADRQQGSFEIELQKIVAWRSKATGSTNAGFAGQRDRTLALAALIDRGGDAQQLAEAMRSTERVLVVAAPGELEAEASKQVGQLLAHGLELADRQLRILQLMGTSGGRVAGRTLSGQQVRSLRQRFDLPSNEWAVALVGTDGAVEERWSNLVTSDEIFTLLDEM